MSFSIAGKTAVVTGAANGVGLSIARHFLDAGANVMFADMDEASLAEELGDDPDLLMAMNGKLSERVRRSVCEDPNWAMKIIESCRCVRNSARSSMTSSASPRVRTNGTMISTLVKPISSRTRTVSSGRSSLWNDISTVCGSGMQRLESACAKGIRSPGSPRS